MAINPVAHICMVLISMKWRHAICCVLSIVYRCQDSIGIFFFFSSLLLNPLYIVIKRKKGLFFLFLASCSYSDVCFSIRVMLIEYFFCHIHKQNCGLILLN